MNAVLRAQAHSIESSPFVFAGPSRTLIASDLGETFSGQLQDSSAWLDPCAASLAGDPSRYVVGALPFMPSSCVRLFVPTRMAEHGPWDVPDTTARSRRSATKQDDAAFTDAVREALASIERGEFDKVVLSRQSVFDCRVDSRAALLTNFRGREPLGFTFACDVGEGRTLVGASPELLLSKRGRRVVSVPLAGSAPRSADPNEDARRAHALRDSAKDRHEHALVVHDVKERLGVFCRELRAEPDPCVTATSSLWHLSTRIEGQLHDDVSALELACALHPTPAVCGLPRNAARDAIGRLEAFDRDYFTGAVGWMNGRGDGDWVVAIRCAELIDGGRVRVFAGAGIVTGSTPEGELRETGVKMQTALAALNA